MSYHASIRLNRSELCVVNKVFKIEEKGYCGMIQAWQYHVRPLYLSKRYSEDVMDHPLNLR
jgi:hypothetical protein